MIAGTMHGAAFLAYAEQVLAPTLKPRIALPTSSPGVRMPYHDLFSRDMPSISVASRH